MPACWPFLDYGIQRYFDDSKWSHAERRDLVHKSWRFASMARSMTGMDGYWRIMMLIPATQYPDVPQFPDLCIPRKLHPLDRIMMGDRELSDIDVDIKEGLGGYSALHVACMYANRGAVEFLIKGKATFTRDFRKRGPLWYAVWSGDVDICRMVVESYPHELQPSETFPRSFPLSLAVQLGRTEVGLYVR